MDTLFQDLRYALRGLRRSPGFAVVTILTLALGIGANTAIFSVVNAVLLRPLPYAAPDRLVQVWETDRRLDSGAQDFDEGVVSPLNLADWREQARGFEGLAAYEYQAPTLTGGDRPERVIAAGVSASFFRTLGATPFIGRDFRPEEATPGRNHVLILSRSFWVRRFAADPSIVGRSILLDGEPYTVVGVMPEDVRFPEPVQVWTPLALDLGQIRRGQHFLFAIGRLKAGTTLNAAQAEMDAIARGLAETYPNTNEGQGVRLVPLQRQLVAGVRSRLLILLGAVGFVLLIACVNVANLSLVRASGRGTETAIRAALGASRGRLTRLHLTESLVLALIAGGLGLLLAVWGVQMLVAASPQDLSRAGSVSPDGRVLAFTLAVSLLTGLLFGLVPALQSSGSRLAEALKEGGRTVGDGQGRLRRSLVISEIALALILLVGAGLLGQSFLRLSEQDPGFRAADVLTARLELPASRYEQPADQVAFAEQVLGALERRPGLKSAALVDDLPFSGSRSASGFDIEGRAADDAGPVRSADARRVSPAYFQAMGIPLLRGRGITARDTRESPPVAVINEAFARRFFPDTDPLGRRIRMGPPEEVAFYGEAVWREIVGVIGDIKHDDLRVRPAPEMYTPLAQLPSRRLYLVARSSIGVSAASDVIRGAVADVDPDLAVYSIQPMEGRLARSIALPRFNAELLGLLAAMALLLAAIGIYGVVSHAVASRTREIGIRLTLGAEPGRVLGRTIVAGMRDIGLGLAAGLVGALALTRLLRGLLFGVGATDPLTLATGAIALALVGLLACWIPARRAARVDPMVALRQE